MTTEEVASHRGLAAQVLIHMAMLLRFVGGVSAALLLFVAWHGGFRLRTSWGMVSCTNFDTVFWVCVGMTVVAGGVSRAVGAMPQAGAAPGVSVSRAGRNCLMLSIGLVHAGFWVRSCYISYHAHLLDPSAQVFPPLWVSGIVYAAMTCCSVAIWVVARRRLSDTERALGVLLVAVLPLMLYVSVWVALAYAATLVVWGVGACLSRAMTRFRRVAALWIAPGVMVAAAVVLHVVGAGWAGNRVAPRMAARMFPLWSVLLVVACGLWGARSRGLLRAHTVVGAFAAAALGVALLGIELPHGELGVVFAVPLTAILAGCGATQLQDLGRRVSGVYGRNIAVVLTVALVIATVRAGLQRSVEPPPGVETEQLTIVSQSTEGDVGI